MPVLFNINEVGDKLIAKVDECQEGTTRNNEKRSKSIQMPSEHMRCKRLGVNPFSFFIYLFIYFILKSGFLRFLPQVLFLATSQSINATSYMSKPSFFCVVLLQTSEK